MYLLLYKYKVFKLIFYNYLFTKINIKSYYLFILQFSLKKSLLLKKCFFFHIISFLIVTFMHTHSYSFILFICIYPYGDFLILTIHFSFNSLSTLCNYRFILYFSIKNIKNLIRTNFVNFWSYKISKTKQENNTNKTFIESKILWVQSQK